MINDREDWTEMEYEKADIKKKNAVHPEYASCV